MNKRSLRALIVLNLVLLGALLFSVVSPDAAFGQRRRGGDRYVMISGMTEQRTDFDVIYVMNVDTNRVAAITYESNNDRFKVIAGHDLTRDLSGSTRRR